MKARRAMPCEASHEEKLVYISEADARVVDYLTQPHRLEMYPTNSRRKLVYFPDMWRQMSDGSIEIVETKKTWAEVHRKPEYTTKLKWAKRVYEQLNYTFRIVTEEDYLSVGPLTQNAKMIALDNKTAWRTEDRLRLLGAFSDAGVSSIGYGEAINSLVAADRDKIHATAILHAMIVRRIVSIDIHSVIDINSPVTLLETAE
jgi:hypothetical protein